MKKYKNDFLLKNKKTSYYEGFDVMDKLKDILIELKRSQI
ncbi:hypothetical protein Marpi_0286 [Marinitoga piezophila KA3]|uniref:Uncharacterized protein n=1 Tax=Marinitoga piezophila (strain DSM 14283 / JCM 11233 / KA3) TaxID=443254 RepID=H2J409_MARPK|nr:hypothetical protein Marpi_0286 [Marinitoga piezophila KA3]